MKHTKSTVSFVSLKNVEVLRPRKLPWFFSLHQWAQQGLAWLGVCFLCEWPGQISGLGDSVSFSASYFWFFWLCLNCSIFGLWTCTDYLIISSTNSLKGKGGKKQVFLYFYCWLKKITPLASLLYQFTGSKFQRHQKLKSSHTC